MDDVKPLKLVDQGGGAGRLAEFEAGDTLPKAALPALSAADVGAVAADDPRLSDAREWSAETVSQTEAEAGTATTRRAWTAQRVRQAIVAWWNSVSSAWGRDFVSSADAAAGRTALGLGNAATRTALGTTGGLYSRDSILGPVSQSGGVPTGAIIERGSNANGEYIRWADGTQICTKILTVSLAIDIVFGSMYASAAIQLGTPAASFINTPAASPTGWDATGNSLLTFTNTAPTASNLGVIYLGRPSSQGALNRHVHVTAIGRWF